MRRRALALLGGLLLGVGAAEAAARMVTPSPGEQLLFAAPNLTPKGMYTFSETYLTLPTAGFTGEIASLGYRVPIRINSLSTRGPEPGSGRKWLALGDSFVMAAQVAEADTFAARLGVKEGVEVINAGVDGWSTWQSLRRYRELDDRTGADTAVLVYFLGNDLEDNERVPHMLKNPTPPGQGPGGHAPPEVSTDPVTRFLFTHSYAFAYARVAMKRHTLATDFDGKRFKDELLPFSAGGRQRLQNLVGHSREPLRQLRDEARARGDRLVVAVAPPAFAVDPWVAETTFELFGVEGPEVNNPRDAVVGLLGELGIAGCDLTPPLAAAVARGEAPYFRFDGHWSPVGHAVVADALADCLK
ncbi:MAG: alginate O-acetyltransferase AlgX-related protein [Myxococcota bacterium]